MFLRFAAVAVFAVMSTGCSLTYPIRSSSTAQYLGRTMTVQNRAWLLASDDFPSLEIATGLIPGYQQKVAEIPEGTKIQVRSFWRCKRWLPIGGLTTTDFAWVTATPASTSRTNARLRVVEFDDVFNASKYIPMAAEEVE